MSARPPRLAAWLIGRRVDAADREHALGDLDEEYAARAARHGRAAARRWYWRAALSEILPGRISAPRAPRKFYREEFRAALRALRRAPAASAAAILTYALGIGANIAIFSVAWPVLVAPLPFPDEQQLVDFWLTVEREGGGFGTNPISEGDYNDIRSASAFAATAAYSSRLAQLNLVTGTDPRQVAVAHVTPAFFTVLGVQPLQGRTFLPSDEDTNRNLLVLNARTWRTAFGADPGIIGRVVRIDNTPVEIVGVVPSTTGLGTHDADAWWMMTLSTSRARERAYFLRAIGRLRPDVSLDAANAELATIMARAAEEFPEANRFVSARAFSFREAVTGPSRASLMALTLGAGLLLMVAAINLTGLMTARTLQRVREVAIRRALGASRARVWSQFAIEQLVLALAGGLVGMAAAWLALDLVIGLAPQGTWHPDRALSTPAVLVVTTLLSLALGLLVAAVPAWRAASGGHALQTQTRGATASRATTRARTTIIAAQVALTVMLLVSASLVAVSLARVLGVDPGFRGGGTLVADIALPPSDYDAARARQFFDTLVERAGALPAASGACALNEMPLENDGGMTWVPEGTTTLVLATHKSVTAGCFDVLGVPLIRGRLLTASEPDGAVLVSESMARALWPDDRDPIGRQIHMGLPAGPAMTIVGIVGDIHNVSLERDSQRQVWMSHEVRYFPPRRILVRSAGVAPASLAAPLRAVVRDLDAGLALANLRTVDDIVDRATAPRRFVLWLLGGFAVIALLLSAIGIYGVLAYLVGQRTTEIGLRRALGAPTSHITALVAGTVGLAIAIGTSAGLAGAWGVSSLVASLLYEMSATDVRVYAAVAVFVALASALAAWPPAQRAARIDPGRALRN